MRRPTASTRAAARSTGTEGLLRSRAGLVTTRASVRKGTTRTSAVIHRVVAAISSASERSAAPSRTNCRIIVGSNDSVSRSPMARRSPAWRALTRVCVLGDRGAEEDATGGRVLQEGHDELAVAVERGRLPHQRQDAVGARELEEAVDVVVREAVRNAPQHQLPAKLAAEAAAPLALIRRQRRRGQVPTRERAQQRFGRENCAQQAVVDAAARRRLDDS